MCVCVCTRMRARAAAEVPNHPGSFSDVNINNTVSTVTVQLEEGTDI